MENEVEETKVVLNIFRVGKSIYKSWKIILPIIGGIGYAIYVGYGIYDNTQRIIENNKKIPILQREIERDSINLFEMDERIKRDSLEYIQQTN
jgi:hypothetical protein